VSQTYYLGEVRNGVVVFDAPPPDLPTGARVRVEALSGEPSETNLQRDLDALRELLLSVADKAEGLPSDMAERHDHCLHGTLER
jgi:hypothetical protein